MTSPVGASGKGSASVRVGISACLLGQEVRFDGGHKPRPVLTDTLGNFFEWVPVCPEVEMGLGTPGNASPHRRPGGPRLIFAKTAAMRRTG